MAASANDMASRKPSGSSTRSGAHSPNGSPGHASPQRRLTPNQAGAMLGVGIGVARPFKTLNSGWQVWGAKRNVSSAAVSSANDRASMHVTDAGYRSLSEGWRSSPAWEDATNGTLKDPVQYDTLSPGGMRSRQVSSTSPSGGLNLSRVHPSVVENDLAVNLRGMTVEESYSNTDQSSAGLGQQSTGVHAVRRASTQHSPRGQQARSAYATNVSQAESMSYHGREPYADYSFPYEAYRTVSDPAVYAATSVPAMAPAPYPTQPANYFDYSTALPPSGFYFASPAMHPQIAPAMMYPAAVNSSSSPHHRFARPVDYSPQLPMMVSAGAVYPNLNVPQAFPPRVHQDRRRGSHQVPQSHQNQVSYPAHGAQNRSALLEEFRMNKARKWELKDIIGHVVEFSSDQHGSRFIQHKLDTASIDIKQKVFDEIAPVHVLDLIQDVFGNYVIQKLFEHGTTVQKNELISTMETHILTLSLQMYGCRVVQKAIDHITPEQQTGFVRELEAHVMHCVKDANGNHVIQKLIERVAPERLPFIASFCGNVYELASHPYGCRVLQRCLEHLGLEATRPLLDELQKYTAELMQDQFGNYVIQFLLENGETQDREVVISTLRGQVLHMARHKFASNVVEKALIMADSDTKRQLIDELLVQRPDGSSPVVIMMKDQYANYVLQRAMANAEGPQQQELAKVVKPQLALMRKMSTVYTKHLNSIERCLNKIQKVGDA